MITVTQSDTGRTVIGPDGREGEIRFFSGTTVLWNGEIDEVTADLALLQWKKPDAIEAARIFQRHTLLRTFDDTGEIDATCLRASDLIGALISEILKERTRQ